MGSLSLPGCLLCESKGNRQILVMYTFHIYEIGPITHLLDYHYLLSYTVDDGERALGSQFLQATSATGGWS